MSHETVLQNNRNELFEGVAVRAHRKVVHGTRVSYMDLRPYPYSSTITRFDPSEVEEILKDIRFKRLPNTIFLGDSPENQTMLDTLKAHHLPYDCLPIMTVTQKTLKNVRDKATDFTVTRVKDTATLEAWCAILADGLFNNDTLDISLMSDVFQTVLDDPNYFLVIGHHTGVPACAGICYLSTTDQDEAVGGIYMVGTKKSHRRKGLASMLTHELTQALIADGADYVILDASEMGHGIYSDLGFIEVGYSYRFHIE